MTDLGTIYKINIHIEGLPTNMDDVDFTARFYNNIAVIGGK